MRCRRGTPPPETMTKDKSKKSKKKKEQGKGKEEEVDEGIPLKTANEFRRTNRMEPLSKEQWEQRRAVIRANNEKLEKQLVQMKQEHSNKIKPIRPERAIKHLRHSVAIRGENCTCPRSEGGRRRDSEKLPTNCQPGVL